MDNTVLPIWKTPGMTSYDVVRIIKNQNKKEGKITIDEYSKIYWWEYIHRTIGRIIGLLAIIPFFYFRTVFSHHIF